MLLAFFFAEFSRKGSKSSGRRPAHDDDVVFQRKEERLLDDGACRDPLDFALCLQILDENSRMSRGCYRYAGGTLQLRDGINNFHSYFATDRTMRYGLLVPFLATVRNCTIFITQLSAIMHLFSPHTETLAYSTRAPRCCRSSSCTHNFPIRTFSLAPSRKCGAYVFTNDPVRFDVTPLVSGEP